MRELSDRVLLAACAVGMFGCGSVEDSAPDAPGRADAAVDATPDAPERAVQYDIGYVDNFTVNPNITGMFGFVVVVNTGTAPLDLATASVLTFTDDNPDVQWSFAKEASSPVLLARGRAAGFLTQAARDKVLTTSVVTEPVDDDRLSFGMTFATPLTAGLTLQAEAVIQINGVDIKIPFTIQVAGSGVQLNSARRMSAPR